MVRRRPVDRRAPGFAVRSIQTNNTVAAASPSSTGRAICSPAGTVTDYATPASRRARKVEPSAARERSECGSVAVPTCYSPFRKGRAECTSARTCAFAPVTLLLHLTSPRGRHHPGHACLQAAPQGRGVPSRPAGCLAIGEILQLFTPEQCASYLANSGYART